MQDGLQLLSFDFGQHGLHGFGLRGAFLQAGQATVIERMDGVSDCLTGAGQGVSNLHRLQAVGTGEQDLAAAQDKGLFGAQAGFEGGPFLLGEITNEDRV
jgi:hypothetical protein